MATKKNQYRAQPTNTIDFDAVMARADSMLANSQPAEQAKQGTGVLRTMGDMAIKGAQGVVDLGASAVGLGSMVTGGMVGDGMGAMGYDPKRTNLAMGEYLSQAQKDSDAKVQNAEGFLETVGQAATEPRFLAGAVVRSLPGLLAMGGVQGAMARSIAGKAALSTAEGAAAATGLKGTEAITAALSTKAGGTAAKAAIQAAVGKLIALGATTEGAQAAGGIAQEAQQAGRTWDQYTPAALGAGAMTAAIGFGAGKIMGDAGTKIFTGADTKLAGSLPMNMAKSGFSEGVLEEMPQSASEQAFRNLAMGEADLMKGVPNAAGTGLVTGAAIGLGFGAMGGSNAKTPQQAEADAIRATDLVPESGALTRAVNAGTEAKARAIESMPTNFSATPMATMGSAVNANAGMGFDMGSLPSGMGAPAEIIDQADLDSLVETERRDQQVMQAQMAQDRQKQAEIEAAFAAKPELDATTAAVEQAATIDAPNAMQAAFNKLADKTIGPEPVAPPVAAKEPRIVARTPDMKPMPMELAELQVDMDGGEVARVKNANGKYGYVVVPKPVAPVKLTAATAKTDTGMKEGDTGNSKGKPFTNFFSANAEASRKGAGYEPIKLRDNAFVVRAIPAKPAETNTPTDGEAGNITTLAEPENQSNQPLASESIAPVATESVATSFDVTHAGNAAIAAPENAGVVAAYNQTQFTQNADGSTKRVGRDHFESWANSGGVTSDVGSQYDGHGIAKGNPLGALLNILTNGINTSRRFDSAPLTPKSSAAGAGSGLGSANGAYKDGPFILLGARGKSILDGIKTVLVSDEVAASIPALQQRFPEVRFVSHSNAQSVLSQDGTATTPAATPATAPVTQPAQPVTQPDQQSGARVQFFQPPTEKHKKGILYTGEIVTRGGKQVVTLDKDSPSFAAGVREVAYRENGGWEPAQPVTGEGAGGSRPAEPAPKPAATKSGITLAGWTPETGSQGNTIWTKVANSELYTATLDPSSSIMEVTALVGVVDTQIASFKVESSDQAARMASEAVARDVAETSATGKGEPQKSPSKGKSLAEIKAAKFLDSEIRNSESGEVTSRKEWVERKVADGEKPTIRMIDKIKPMTRTAFNRATNQEQEAHEKRIKEAGKVPEYSIGDFLVTKTEYDYALTLPAQDDPKEGGSASENIVGRKDSAQIAQPESVVIDSTTKPSALTEQENAAKAGSAKIEDSGEVLEGARKLYAKSYSAKLEEGAGMDTAAVPLSKSWPEPDYQRLIDEGADPWAVAMARAMRDEVPTKPSSWKLKGWVQKVESLRAMAADVMSGALTQEKFKTAGGQFNLADWFNKIDLYEAVGHANSLKSLKFSMGEFGMYGGQTFKPAKKLWTINMPGKSNASNWSNGNWGNDLVVADTKEDAIEKFKAWSAAQGEKPPAEAKATSFDIYSYRNKPGVTIVGKRINSTKSIDLKEFSTVKEAREYKTANQAELEKLLAEAKFEPSERRESNAPRVGDDHRNGADVTSDQFRETFGFRGEQFGASMPQGERQANLNQAYDALMDLAGVVGVPPKALSLNGELGMAFGARGTGGKNPAAAHYERDTTGAVTPNRVVINLTRKNGAGSLAHEWFHAVDNYFARMRGEKAGMLTESYANRGEGVRPEMVAAFKQLMAAIQTSGIKERSKQLDKKRVKDYWSTGLEMAARSFESYVIAKLQDQNGSNDYLANIVPESMYAMQSSYPYPVMGELPAIRAAFDAFFDAVQTKETDQGVAMFSRSKRESSVLSANGKFKGWPKFNTWTRQEYSDVVSLLPEAYRDDAHRLDPVATKDWDALAAAVLPELDALNEVSGVGTFRLDDLGNILVDERKSGRDAVVEDALPIAEKHGLGIFVTGVRTESIAYYRDAGFVPELGLGAILARATGSNQPPMPMMSGQVNNTAYGTMMSYKPRGFPKPMFSRAGVDQPSRILEVNEANRDKTNKLQGILKKQGYDFDITPASLPVDVADDAGGRASGSSPSNSFALAERIASVFGKEVVWVSTDGPFFINGVVVPGGALSKQVFLNVNAEHPSHVILGHELTHHMEKDAPGAYKALMTAINGLLRNHDAYRAKYGLEGASNDFVAKEMIGDLMGDNFDKREFWNLVAKEANGTYFRIIANSISKWLTGLLTKLKLGGLGSHQFVTDVQEARSMLAKAVAEYSKVTTPTAPATGNITSRVAFGRGTNEAVTNPNDVVGNQNGRSADDTTPGAAFDIDEYVEYIEPPHHVKDKQKLGKLVTEMEANGWIGRPILAYQNDGAYFALTGSHRIAAAKKVGIEIPVMLVDDDVVNFESDSGEFLQEIAGSGDDRVADFLRDAGDSRSADLMDAEVDAYLGHNPNESTAPDSGGVMFSRSLGATLTDAANNTQEALKNATVTDLLKQFGNRLGDFRGLGLQTLGRRQLVDIYGKDLPAMVAYSDMVAQMEADKNESGAEADGLATDWGKLKDERQLAELMHDATLAQIDPSKDFAEGDDANFYDALKDGYDKLTPDAKKAFLASRDMYSAHNEKVRKAIRERITRSELSSTKKQALLERMDGEFFKKVKGVYFPLARFGSYVTIVKDSEGNVVSANRSETMNEAEATRKVLQTQFPASGGFKVGKVLRDREFNAARDGVGRGFMADLFQTLEKTGAGEELMDSISQLYLAALPDLSWAKHGIHRKGTPGFSQDARRAFAQNMFHGARYLAKLRYADQLQTGLDTMQKQIADQVDNEAYDSVKAQQVVDEMVKRHESLMNPASNPLSTALTSMGFVFHLGLSPASALVNLSQTALVALPIMGAKWGFTKSSAALLVASKQAAGNKNDISTVLKGDERTAYNEAVRRGVIDVTMAHDLAGIAQGEDSKVSAAFKPVMKYASFLFHHAEKFNRQVTFVAAYRLAREAGTAHEAAFDDAVKATYDGHFDYSACVDDQTEILTLSGWKKRVDLLVGDTAIATDSEGKAVESKVTAVNVYEGDREVIEFQSSRSFNMVLTPNHDAIVQNYSSRDKKWQSIRKVQAGDLKNHHFIVRAPLAAIERSGSGMGEDMATLLGWIAAEGWYSKYRKTTEATDVRLAQSNTHNPEYLTEISELLTKMGGDFKVYTYKRAKDTLTTFVLRRSLGRQIQQHMPNKMLTAEMLSTMSTMEMRGFLMAFLKGDGTQYKNGTTWCVGQKAGANLDVLQAMATMCGMRSTLSKLKANGMRDLYVVVNDEGCRSHVRPLTQTRRTEPLVWCPTTEHGTWIARRNGTVFVTGNSNRPRLMQGNVARVVFLFKQYSQNMIYTLTRSAQQAIKAETPEGRAEARKALSGLLVSHAMAAGVFGLPVVGMLMSAASAIGGDDDEPWDAKVALKNMLADSLGPKSAEVFAHGLSRLTPWDISGRVGLDRLLLPDVQEGLEGTRAAESWAAQALGPVVGIGINMVKGLSEMGKGEYQRGLESMLPSALRGPMKAYRLETEGNIDKSGVAINDEVSGAGVAGQALGFSPSETRLAQEGKSAIYSADRAIQARRTNLVRQFALASMATDAEGVQDARKDIARFNEKNPKARITQTQLVSSIRARQRRINEAKQGVYLPSKRQDAMEAGRFAVAE